MDDQMAAEMIGVWTMLSNIVSMGLLMSAAMIAAMGFRGGAGAPIRVRRRWTN